MEHKSQTQQQQDNTQHVIQDPSLTLLCFVISANHARH
jgi:VanZ family protein